MSIEHPKKSRGPRNTELIYGFHSAESRITRSPESIFEAYIDRARHDTRMQKLVSSLDRLGIPYQLVPKRELSKLADANHQGVIFRAKVAAQKTEKGLYAHLDTVDQPFILVLDQITDPHNLGACLRTADAVGVDAVVLPKDGACPINETVRRVASGAAESVEVFYVTNLVRCLKEIKDRGVWAVGLSDSATQSLADVSLTPPLAVVMGAEGKGLRKLTQSTCDQLVSIPMKGSVSSLNVSVATGVVLFAVQKD